VIPVADARARILAALPTVGTEDVGLDEAAGRVLAEPVFARLTQPPFAVSAMDGWAVRAADLRSVPARLRPIGAIPAGAAFGGTVGPGETVRIFTGAPLPAGADAVLIQEDAEIDPATGFVVARESVTVGRFVRRAGLDFAAGDAGPPAGRRLTPRDIGLLAAMNHPFLTVRRRPVIAILATGDEIVRPGEPIGSAQIVSSNAFALTALVRLAGGVPINLGIAPDDGAVIAGRVQGARYADLIVTTGGASVGEHDLVRAGLEPAGLTLDFWRIAMRPGKPLMFGRVGDTPLLGLPGNPVSSLVCAHLFLRPAIERLLGVASPSGWAMRARLAVALEANDRREDYLRATVEQRPDGDWVTPLPVQDSSMVAALARADGLAVRPPLAPAAAVGDPIDFIRFATGPGPF
jgi:molybdopterin molybdotransferase